MHPKSEQEEDYCLCADSIIIYTVAAVNDIPFACLFKRGLSIGRNAKKLLKYAWYGRFGCTYHHTGHANCYIWLMELVLQQPIKQLITQKNSQKGGGLHEVST